MTTWLQQGGWQNFAAPFKQNRKIIRPVKDAIHDVSASSTDSRSKPDSTEDVKEIIPSAISTEAAGMILIPDWSTGWSQTRGPRLKEEGLQKTAQLRCSSTSRVSAKKKSTGRKSQEWQTATMKQKGGFGHDNDRKHALFFGRKSTIFAQTFGFGLYFG